MEDKQWKYKIGSGKMPMILTFMMLVLFGGLAIWLQFNTNKRTCTQFKMGAGLIFFNPNRSF